MSSELKFENRFLCHASVKTPSFEISSISHVHAPEIIESLVLTDVKYICYYYSEYYHGMPPPHPYDPQHATSGRTGRATAGLACTRHALGSSTLLTLCGVSRALTVARPLQATPALDCADGLPRSLPRAASMASASLAIVTASPGSWVPRAQSITCRNHRCAARISAPV